jgi:hypothetical protein
MAITVSSEIERILRQKEAGIISAVEAMRSIMEALHSQVLAELGKAALGSWDAYKMKQLLNSLEMQMAGYEAQAAAELTVQLKNAWGTGIELVDAPLAVSGIYTGFHLGTETLTALTDYSNEYLSSAFGDLWAKVKGEINLGVLGGKTPAEVAKAIGRSIDAGRFENVAYRAETITKTEMGRVFSTAAQLRMEQAAANVPGLEKQWIHAGHPKVSRPAHVAASGQHVPVGEAFIVGGMRMMYPRAPELEISEVIHCGCDHVPYHANWE